MTNRGLAPNKFENYVQCSAVFSFYHPQPKDLYFAQFCCAVFCKLSSACQKRTDVEAKHTAKFVLHPLLPLGPLSSHF